MNQSDLACLMQASRWCCVFAISMSGALQLDGPEEEVLEPDKPELEIPAPSNSDTDIESETTASTTSRTTVGTLIIEEARRRCEQDQNKEALVQKHLQEALGQEAAPAGLEVPPGLDGSQAAPSRGKPRARTNKKQKQGMKPHCVDGAAEASRYLTCVAKCYATDAKEGPGKWGCARPAGRRSAVSALRPIRFVSSAVFC